MRRPAVWFFAASLLVGIAGCHAINTAELITEQSLLKAALPAADAVTLDIFWVKLPEAGDADEQQLWTALREDCLPVELRQRLASNGLRAGVVGATPPDVLLRWIDPEGKADTSTAGVTELRETGVRKRTRQMRPGQTVELNASEVIDETPLLVSRDGRLSGQTYQQAQGVYVLTTESAGDDRVRVSLLPEIRHGQQLLRFVSDDTGAITRGSLKRQAVAMADLAIAAPLAAGEMLLVTNLPQSGSRLGGLFHGADGQRKAIVVRVAQAPTNRAFIASL